MEHSAAHASPARPFADRLLPPWVPTRGYRERGVIDVGAVVSGLVFTPDADHLAGAVYRTRRAEGNLRLWKRETGEEVARFGPHGSTKPSEQGTPLLAASPDGGWLAVGRESAFDVFDISRPSAGRPIEPVLGERERVTFGKLLLDLVAGAVDKGVTRSCAWAPDGRRLATVRGGALYATVADERRKFMGFKISRLEKPAGVAFSPDGRLFATVAQTKASGRGLYLLDQVDVVRGEARTHFAFEQPILRAGGPLDWRDVRITFSPDGRRVLVADHQHWVRPRFPATGQRVYLVDTATGEPCAVPPIVERADKDRPMLFAWQPDGRIGGILYMDGRRYGCVLDGATAELLRQEEDAEDAWTRWLQPPLTSGGFAPYMGSTNGSIVARSADGRRFAIARGTTITLYEFD